MRVAAAAAGFVLMPISVLSVAAVPKMLMTIIDDFTDQKQNAAHGCLPCAAFADFCGFTILNPILDETCSV